MSHAAFTVVPSDTVNLPGVTVGGLFVGGAGNIVAQPAAGGPAVTLTGILAGTLIPLVVSKVFATGTTATSIIGFPVGRPAGT